MIHMKRTALAVAAASLIPCAGFAQGTDAQSLKREIDALRAEYEARIQALEARVKAAETAAASAVAAPPTAASGTGVNPALSLILSGTYARTSRDPAQYRISGFRQPPDAEIGPGTRGLSLGESELGISANIDPWFSGAANISFTPDNSVSVEEAYVQTTSLGHGLTLKAGRFFSSVGYLNSQHAHVWDFVDAPLAYQAMLGTQYNDDGLQLAWLAPTDQFIELRAEVGRGRSYPGTASSRNGAGMAALSLHTGGDIGDSHSWRAGVSVLQAKASDQALAGVDATGAPVTSAFSGTTRVWIADAVWKWAPDGNATRTNFKLQGEYLHSTREGDMVADVSQLAAPGSWRAAQSGWYLQGIYQFMPRWRVGLRTERLNPGAVAGEGWNPARHSLMLDFNPSEFSRVRVQLARDRSRPGFADTQFFLQYQMSLGAHGAHSF